MVGEEADGRKKKAATTKERKIDLVDRIRVWT